LDAETKAALLGPPSPNRCDKHEAEFWPAVSKAINSFQEESEAVAAGIAGSKIRGVDDRPRDLLISMLNLPALIALAVAVGTFMAGAIIPAQPKQPVEVRVVD
jgi:hypothetical protein